MPVKKWARSNVDILLGLLAWGVALGTIVASYIPTDGTRLVFGLLVIPVCWIVCVVQAIRHRRRHVVYLLWILLSAPAALQGWFYLVALAIGFSNFAP